jgi:hypothetical protein
MNLEFIVHIAISMVKCNLEKDFHNCAHVTKEFFGGEF